ncbi:MAG: Xaa-Pro peptidase family protein [Candidatus Omnitrophica bacterium]|nr:Xaa-Pro peptidase family protein [Candidatus Omnitrophota bacterium]
MKKKCSGFISAPAGRLFLLAIFIMITLGLVPALALADSALASSLSSPYSPEEFARRRLALMELVASSYPGSDPNASASSYPGASPKPGAGPGSSPSPGTNANSLIILFASSGHSDSASTAAHFRQDNDFYYFTGCEDADAVLVMLPATREAMLFVPEKSAGEKKFEGPNSLDDPTARDRFKVGAILPLSNFDEFLARFYGRQKPVFYLRLSPGDTVSGARYESALYQARGQRNGYNSRLTLDQLRAERFRQLFPAARLEDVTSLIDSMRMIKSPEEIAVLRRNGQISAEAVKKAMLASRPAAFEYELEAAAMEVLLRNGCRGPAFAPIIGSGPNTCIMHYDRNNRQMQAGELVLMDFGGDLNYLTMDITRTWPVSGKFTAEQKKIYRTVLEVQKACIEAFKPGITSKDVGDYVARRLKEKGIDPMGLRGGLGHLVGMCVHDVQTSPGPLVLKEGMVMAIEPALYFPDKNIGIRIEDTVLITRDGCDVLTSSVPKEIEEIEALLSRRN